MYEVREASDVGIFEGHQEGEEDAEEHDSRAQYAAPHRVVDDEAFPVSRFLVHHPACRRQRCQRHGREGVHDQVDPQHLRDRQRRLRPHERPHQHNQAGHHVHRHLEEDEPLYVLVQRASPHHRPSYRAERVVDDGDVACLLRHRRAVTHGQPDMSRLQSRGVVGAVSRDCHHLAFGLQRFHQPFLVHRPGPCNDFDLLCALLQFFVTHRRDLRSRLDIHSHLVFVLVPETYLPCNLTCGRRSVTRDHLHLDAGIRAFPHRIRHVLTHGVADGHEPLECQVARVEPAILDRYPVVGEAPACESQRTHALVLVRDQFAGDILLGLAARYLRAHLEDDFRRPFDVDHRRALELALDDGRHVFLVSRERYLTRLFQASPDFGVVAAILMQPEKQCPLRRVAQHLWGAIGTVQFCRGVARHVLRHLLLTPL